MGLFDFLRGKKKISAADQAVIDNFRNSVNTLLNTPRKQVSPDEYARIREAEREWFKNHYDLSSIESISAIPERLDLPKPPGNTPTSEVYYYLRYMARQLESDGNSSLALACMKKSISLMQLKYGATYGREECYSYVRMLVRNGFDAEARIAKVHFDNYYNMGIEAEKLKQFQIVCKQAAELRTDLLMMSVQGITCPECARYQGRVYSISGKSKIYPRLPIAVTQTGVIHKGCTHQFFPYIHGSTNVHMDYILSVHPLMNKSFARDIVTFSNRPFVDDRTEASKAAAETAITKRRTAKLSKQQYDELMIEREIEKRNDYQNFEWLKANFPEKCPSSPSGYRRMKTQNTKNFQILKQLAAERGKTI